MSYTVTDEERKRLKDEYGKPPSRDTPLTVERDNMVYVCNAHGPLYTIEKGRVFKTGLTKEDAKESRSIATHHGVVDGDDTLEYVNVRYGTATMECCYVPVTWVLEVLADECRWDNDERGYVAV